jgi:hypothetical protein
MEFWKMVKKHQIFVSKLVGLSTIGVFIPMLSTIAQTQWPSGCYRQSDRPEVYCLNSSSSTYCHVQNPSQMDTFGGFGQVRVVGTNRFLAGANNIGECGWLNGFYRRKSKLEVYRLNNDTKACWVSSPEMMDAYGGFKQVRVVEDSSDLFAQREYEGDCIWPR